MALQPTLLIGGAGFIGTELARSLSLQDRKVVVLGRGAERPVRLPAPCDYVCGDYANRGQLRSLLTPGCDVVNLAYATVPKTSFSDPTFDLLANLPASVTLLQLAAEIGVRRLLIVSSGGTVYGSARSLPIAEEHPTAPISPYGITKLTIDSYARMFHATADLPVLVVRPANAYGERQRTGVGQGFIAAAIAAIQAGRNVEIYGANGTVRDYIHVRDVAAGIHSALDHGCPGEVYNLGTGIGASNRDVLDLLTPLAEADGHAVRLIQLPDRRFDVEANVLDAGKLRAASGWQPTISLADGLARCWHAALARRPLGDTADDR